MLKTKFKILFSFLLILLLCMSFFATSVNASEITNADLYVSSGNNYSLSNMVNGNVFVSVNTFEINPTNSTTINGDVYVAADTVIIKSDLTYSDTEKDDIGNPKISVNAVSSISGNLYVIANDFTINPGCEIKGNLYICANKVNLGQNAKISGNVYLAAKSATVNCVIDYDLYASVENFNMEYYGYVNRDLHLTTEFAKLNGYIFRNSFIEAKQISLHNNFINEKDFTVTDADKITLDGEIKGNANINAKEISFDNNCSIKGNLNYSAENKKEIPERNCIWRNIIWRI